jgi:hypothetical protein
MSIGNCHGNVETKKPDAALAARARYMLRCFSGRERKYSAATV